MWFANQWSKCSSKCKGISGVKTRTVMCGVMKFIPPATSDNSTASNSTEESGSGEEVAEEGTKRRKRQTENDEDASKSSENQMGEKSIVIVEDSQCDEASKYEN